MNGSHGIKNLIHQLKMHKTNANRDIRQLFIFKDDANDINIRPYEYDIQVCREDMANPDPYGSDTGSQYLDPCWIELD